MDTLHPAVRTAIENARRSIPDGWTLDNAPNNENADLVIAYLADRLVPPPAADARAKLEQAIDMMRSCAESLREAAKNGGVLQICRVAAFEADRLERFAALSTHEGETPQE